MAKVLVRYCTWWWWGGGDGRGREFGTIPHRFNHFRSCSEPPDKKKKKKKNHSKVKPSHRYKPCREV